MPFGCVGPGVSKVFCTFLALGARLTCDHSPTALMTGQTAFVQVFLLNSAKQHFGAGATVVCTKTCHMPNSAKCSTWQGQKKQAQRDIVAFFREAALRELGSLCTGWKR